MNNFTPGQADIQSASAVKVTVLPNGLRVATAAKPIHTVMVSVFNNVGARNESEAENGISHFLEHMAFKGTTSRTPHEIAVSVERLGADINAFTSKNATAYLINGLADHINPALDILSDIIKNSTLPQDEIDREQNVVVEEINESNDDIQDIAHNALWSTAFPNQPLGREILGPEENVRGFDHATLDEYMSRHYHAANMVVIAVGAVDHDSFVAEVEARFGDIEAKETAPVAPAEYVGGASLIPDDRFEQAQLFVAFPAPGGLTDEFATYDILSDVLGGGMSAPLFQKVREERGLCYSVHAGLAAQADASLFVIQGSTSADNVQEFIKVSCAQLANIAKGQIEENDWVRAHNTVLRQLVSRSEKAIPTAQAIASDLFNRGAVRTMEQQIATYKAVSKEAVIAAAKTLLASIPTIVVAGSAPEADYNAVVAEGLAA